jgi:hypothetical protein
LTLVYAVVDKWVYEVDNSFRRRLASPRSE